MPSLSALNAATAVLLQRPTAAVRSAGDNLVASISPAASGIGSPLVQAQGKITESMFSVNNLDPTQMKARLFERVGKAFGINQDDYASLFAYGSAIKTALGEMKQKSPSDIALIEKKLGLDELGVSLDTVVNAIVDPQSSDSDTLDAALKTFLGETTNGKGENPASIEQDEIGLYRG